MSLGQIDLECDLKTENVCFGHNPSMQHNKDNIDSLVTVDGRKEWTEEYILTSLLNTQR